ncbi:MAG: hypothetical protein K8Q91_00625 [Candidatus Vogelbacteria bacterium]|nr:hypothetical protein [Candidatus Vogelbacteria bacterium]
MKIEIVEAFLNGGPENNEAIGLVGEWSAKQEARVIEGLLTPVDFELERFNLFKESGLMDYAEEALRDAWRIASGEGDQELADGIRDRFMENGFLIPEGE